MRLLGRLVRISHRPSPMGRQSGMPTGHLHCARIKSLPISRRSSRGRSFSQSRTGSVPPFVLKKINGVFCGGVLAMSHHGFVVPRKVHACKPLPLPLRFRGFEAARNAAWWSCVTPNVRGKPAPTAGRQARRTENVAARPAGLVACCWRSA